MQGNVKHHNMTVCVCGNIAVKINLCVYFYSSTLYTPIIYSVTVRQYMCVCVICICVNYACYCAIDIVTVTQSDRIEGLWYTLMLRIPDIYLYQEVLMYTYVGKSWYTHVSRSSDTHPRRHVSRSSDTHLYQEILMYTYIVESWYTPISRSPDTHLCLSRSSDIYLYQKVLLHTFVEKSWFSPVSRSLDTHLMFGCLLFMLCNTRQIKRYLVQ